MYSDDQVIGSFGGEAGLNYNSVLGLKTGGGQKVEVMDSPGSVVATAAGTKDVLAESPNSTCNWNYEVVGLS